MPEGAAVGHAWRRVGAYAEGPDTQLGLVHKPLGHDGTRFIVKSREKGRYTATSMWVLSSPPQTLLASSWNLPGIRGLPTDAARELSQAPQPWLK